jgi:hypothetical protein
VDVVGDDADVRDVAGRVAGSGVGHGRTIIVSGSRRLFMARLRSEFDVTCPCCRATLVIDEGLRRVVRHEEPERADRPKLDEAEQILADAKARRDALFEQSVQSERSRSDVLSRRFEEALRQANDEPVTKPTRDFDLD